MKLLRLLYINQLICVFKLGGDGGICLPCLLLAAPTGTSQTAPWQAFLSPPFENARMVSSPRGALFVG